MSKAQSQEYLGNGKHRPENVVSDHTSDVTRLRVPGGWTYSIFLKDTFGHTHFNTVFVPMPEVVKHSV